MNESKLSVSKGARLGVMLLALLAALAAIQAISAEPAEAASTPRPLTGSLLTEDYDRVPMAA